MLVLATWNMAQAWNPSRDPSPWTYLRSLKESEGVQAFMLQEAACPSSSPYRTEPGTTHREEWTLPVPKSRRRYRSAIACADPDLGFRPVLPVPLSRASYSEFFATHPGQFAVADLDLASGETVTLVSLYGLWDRVGKDGDLYADASLHRAISDLAVIFQDRSRKNILVAGDLNIWHRYDSAKTVRGWSAAWARRFQGVFDRLNAHGLELVGPFRADDEPTLPRCPCNGEDCRHVNTYLHNRKSTNVPYQNDYVFATSALQERLVRCYAVSDETVWEHSDHRPVVASFDLD